MQRKIILITGLVLLIGIVTWLFVFKKDASAPSHSSNTPSQNTVPADKEPERIRIMASGDMLPHETVNAQAKKGDNYDYAQFFSQIDSQLKSADIMFCNQESPSAPNLPVTAYPTFNAPAKFAEDLSKVGCNVIGLANNHSYDKGQAGIDGTRTVWDELKPLAIAGANRNAAEQDRIAYFESKGMKFAFVAYSEISNNRAGAAYSLNMLNDQLVKKQLTEARSQADFVIVSAHWGTEYSPKANAAQERWAKTFAENGADLVLGSGPHVLQPVKKLPKAGGGETIVYFSLGNLLSSQLDIESLIGGLAVVDIDPKAKQVQSVGFYPTYMHYEWTADEKAREDLLKRKNLMIYPLESAANPLARSQNKTTVQAQTTRIIDLLNQFTPVKIFKSSEL